MCGIVGVGRRGFGGLWVWGILRRGLEGVLHLGCFDGKGGEGRDGIPA